MKQWKTLCAAAAVLTCAVMAGCGGGDTAKGGSPAPVDLSLSLPKEPVTQVKFGDKTLPLYEYENADYDLDYFDFNKSDPVVTKDGIYGIIYDHDDKKTHLCQLPVTDGAITDIVDLGVVLNRPITSDGTNVYYIPKEGELAVYDGKTTTTIPLQGKETWRAVFGGKDAYAGEEQVNEKGVTHGTIAKDGLKDAKTIPVPARPKPEGYSMVRGAELLYADADGFYTDEAYGNSLQNDEQHPWVIPVYQYSPDGKELRRFELNENIPQGTKQYAAHARCAVATKDYIVFRTSDDPILRVFSKKDGAYVGDIEITDGERTLRPKGIFTDNMNHVYFHTQDGGRQRIFRIDL